MELWIAQKYWEQYVNIKRNKSKAEKKDVEKDEKLTKWVVRGNFNSDTIQNSETSIISSNNVQETEVSKKKWKKMEENNQQVEKYCVSKIKLKKKG